MGSKKYGQNKALSSNSSPATDFPERTTELVREIQDPPVQAGTVEPHPAALSLTGGCIFSEERELEMGRESADFESTVFALFHSLKCSHVTLYFFKAKIVGKFTKENALHFLLTASSSFQGTEKLIFSQKCEPYWRSW